jgi:hypothetical protein
MMTARSALVTAAFAAESSHHATSPVVPPPPLPVGSAVSLTTPNSDDGVATLTALH